MDAGTRLIASVGLLLLAGCARPGVQSAPERSYPIEPAAGCADSAPRLLPPARVSDTLSRDGARFRPLRDAWLARHVPGGWATGPWPTTPDGPSTIWMRDPTQKHAALAALATLAPPDPRYASMIRRDSVIAVAVRWDVAELYDWMEYVLRHRGPGPAGAGFNSSGLDTRNGRIILGIESLETLPALTEWLRSLDIPCHLFEVQRMGPYSLSLSLSLLSASSGGSL